MGFDEIKDSLMQLFLLPQFGDNLRSTNLLLEQLRAATAIELLEPSPDLNAQVITTINAEIVRGKNCWDVADLLKKRLHSSKPQKQWLAVNLLKQVLIECSEGLSEQRDDLLLEVARLWSRPAKPDTPEGKRTRGACVETLEIFGEAGARAQMQIARLDGAWAGRPGMEHAPVRAVVETCMSLPDPKMVKSHSHLNLEEARSLNEMLRKATDKDLTDPNDEINRQVVEFINRDIEAGKEVQDIVDLLRQRLYSHKPRKQWLAIHLVARVLRDCKKGLAAHQGYLLEEVARTMMRPAKPNSDEAKATRDTALDLLHSYGPLGEAAILAANRVDGAWGSGSQPHVDTHSCMAVPAETNASSLSMSETAALKDLMHAATSLDQPEPDEALNAEVCQTIKLHLMHGKNPLAIAQLLTEELESHSTPQRQRLSVRLVGRVLADCGDLLAPVQFEVLRQVARVMIRPAKADTNEGALTRQAAMRLLRASGAVGSRAFAAANQLDGAWGSATEPHIYTGSCMSVPEGASVDVIDAIETSIQGILSAAEAHLQLLRDILVAQEQRPDQQQEQDQDQQQQAHENGGASSSATPPKPKAGAAEDAEFDDQLVKDLVARSVVLHERLLSYKPQMAALAGPQADALREKTDKAQAALEATLARHTK